MLQIKQLQVNDNDNIQSDSLQRWSLEKAIVPVRDPFSYAQMFVI